MTPHPLDLGPFRLQSIVGRGATAEVWRAVHRQRGVPVAVKVLSGIAPDDVTARRRFADEVRAMASLDHRAIIRLHDHGEIPPTIDADQLTPGCPYLVMDWHPGGTLGAHQGRLGFGALRRIVLTVLDALAHAHARGAVHRDLKPANVLDGAEGPVIADFGLVFSREAAGDGRAGGTPNYMAPEQVRGEWRSYGPWTDLYAVGCLTWALATGRAPYAGSGARRAMESHLAGVLPPFLPLMPVPAGLRSWLGRLLEPDPTRRFRFAADAAAALTTLIDASPAPEPAPEPMRPADAGDITADPRALDPTADVSAIDPTVPGAEWRGSDPMPRPAGGPHPTTDRPPMPPHWRQPTPPWTAHLPGCGRGLVELRVPTLAGRAAERDRLWSRLGDVVHGRGAHGVIVRGGSGLGKSRLMRWLAERAHSAGQADTLLIEHAPVPTAVHGLGPIFTRNLRLAGLAPAAAARQIERIGISPAVAAQMAAVDGPGTLTVGEIHVQLDTEARLFDAIAGGLAALASRRALIVQIDDAQWGADAVRLMEHVFDHWPTLPALFVLTVRPGAGDAEISRALDLLGHRAAVDRIDLGTLDPASHEAVAAARLPLTPETGARLARLTGGNPLFADELLRHWLHDEALEETAEGYRLRPDRPDAQPPSLAQLWRTRLDRLLGDMRPDPMPALEIAATLGASVDRAEWQAACTTAGLLMPRAAVERLLDRGLVRRSDDRLVFDHGLLREALEDRARSAGRAERWHQACAEALMRVAEQTGTPPDRVRRATHLAAAGDVDTAVPLWLAAARDHMQRAWHKDIRPAIALLDEVLRYRPTDGRVLADAATCRARLGWLGTSEDDRRQLDAAHDFATRAIAAAGDIGAPHRAMAMVHHYRGEPLAAIRRLEAAIERDPFDGDSHGLAGRVMAEAGPLDRATHHLEHALALGRDTVDLRIELARTHAYRGAWLKVLGLLWDPDPREAQRALADIALARFGLWRGAEHRDPWGTRPPVREPNPIADLFRSVAAAGQAEDHQLGWLEERAARALAGGAPRRAVLFLQTVAELCGYSGDIERTRAAFVAAVDAGLTDRVWARACPLLAGIVGHADHRDGIARIDARLMAADGMGIGA